MSETRQSCRTPAPDGSGRACDKPKGHDGNHWTYGGNELEWPMTDASTPLPLSLAPKQSNEQRYFDALKQITRYDTVERLERTAEKQYGLTPHEAIEMAYENVKGTAEAAIRGKRRPKS